MKKILAALAMALAAGAAAAQSVDFTEPKDGAVVSSPFKVNATAISTPSSEPMKTRKVASARASANVSGICTI